MSEEEPSRRESVSLEKLLSNRAVSDKHPYSSIFMGLKGNWHAMSERQSFSGTLQTILNDAFDFLSVAGLNNVNQKSPYYPIIDYYLNFSRIIRSIIDYREDFAGYLDMTISSEEKSHKIAIFNDLLQDAIHLTISGYIGSKTILDEIDKFKRKAADADYHLLSTIIIQQKDHCSWRGSDPRYSTSTANLLKDKIGPSDILFIALSHGAVAAGLDVFLQYCQAVKSKNSVFYTIRYSRHKRGDRDLKMNMLEGKLLTAAAVNRKVVVFDEDITDGTTLLSAGRVLSTAIEKDSGQVIIATNYHWNLSAPYMEYVNKISRERYQLTLSESELQ